MNLRSLFLFAGFLVVCVTSLLVCVHLAFVADVETEYHTDLQRVLDAKAELALALTPATLPSTPAERATVISAISLRTRARISWIAADGQVLADSQVAPEKLGQLENHSSRPEVVVASGGQRGFSLRQSTSVNENQAYVAVLHAPTKTIIRVSEAASSDAARRTWLVGLLAGGLLALFTGLGAGLWMAQRYGRTLDQLAASAERLLHGEFSVRAKLPRDASVIALRDKLAGVAVSLSNTLSALRSERDLLGRILEGMQEGVLVLADNGEILLVNRALREMWMVPSDIVGKPLLDGFRHAELAEVVQQTRAVQAKVTHELEVKGLKPRRLLLTAAPLVGDGDGVLLVFVDVTDMRRLESLRRDFVANVSHELKTPVTAIKLAAETLREGALDDREVALSFVDMVERNADRLQHLVEDLLELSRIESRAYQFKIAAVPVHELVASTFLLFADRAQRRRVTLRNEVPTILHPARADRRALDQVLSNLVDNAVKYCSEGSTIVVSATERDGRVQVQVSDGGPGIEAKHLPRLFERFYRVDAGRSRDVGGTGLGLSIVKHLTEGMGGTVEVESALGVGTTFIVSLPIARPDQRFASQDAVT